MPVTRHRHMAPASLIEQQLLADAVRTHGAAWMVEYGRLRLQAGAATGRPPCCAVARLVVKTTGLAVAAAAVLVFLAALTIDLV